MGITERLETDRACLPGQGSLYPARRLERQGYVASDWGVTENNRQARFYKLTSAGRRRLAEERARWARIIVPSRLVLRMGRRRRDDANNDPRRHRSCARLARRNNMESRLDGEMRFHLDMLMEQHVRAGLSPTGRRKALTAFGGMERFRTTRATSIESIPRRARTGHPLRRSCDPSEPGFRRGRRPDVRVRHRASTAIFSVVHGVLLRPLPYADPDQLIVLWESQPARGNDRNVVSVPNFEAWRSRARSFERMAGLVPLPATIGVAPNPEHVMGAEVSPGYFEMLGVSPALGRTFASSEERDGGADVIVLSDGFWRSKFGADRRVIGRTLPIDGRPHTIVGVMPPSFDPPRFAWLVDQAFWRPFGPTDNNRGWGRFLLVVGRVKSDVPRKRRFER